jgi:hypothetical protein
LANASQVEALVHASPAPHWVPAATGVWTTPVATLQESDVQGFPSSTGMGAPDTHLANASQVGVAQPFEGPHWVPADMGVWLAPP